MCDLEPGSNTFEAMPQPGRLVRAGVGDFCQRLHSRLCRAESNRALPGAYKSAALWSGQEGPLQLWAWLLTGCGFVLRLRHKVDPQLVAFASTIVAGIEVFFLLLLNFEALPFAQVVAAIPAVGFGMNPRLQYPEMVIHPPGGRALHTSRNLERYT